MYTSISTAERVMGRRSKLELYAKIGYIRENYFWVYFSKSRGKVRFACIPVTGDAHTRPADRSRMARALVEEGWLGNSVDAKRASLIVALAVRGVLNLSDAQVQEMADEICRELEP